MDICTHRIQHGQPIFQLASTLEGRDYPYTKATLSAIADNNTAFHEALQTSIWRLPKKQASVQSTNPTILRKKRKMPPL